MTDIRKMLDETRQAQGIYIASKSVHGKRWRDLRKSGVNVLSSWIDEAEQAATFNWPDLWTRCVSEASECAALIIYREPGEILKGAWVELGAALAAGRPAFAVGIDDFSIRHHPGIVIARTFDEALALALQSPANLTDEALNKVRAMK